MKMIDNTLKRRLRAQEPTAGAWLQLCSPIAAEIMADAGFDWLLVDMEHGHGDYQTLLAQLQAIEGSGVVPLVRVQWNDAAIIKRVLDLGAYGVVIPWVSGREACEAAVAAGKYPPRGMRGMAGSHRAAGFGRLGADYWKRANEETMVIVQIETREAVEDIEAMLRVPDVDVVFVGPTDLSAALGHVGDPHHPEVVEAILSIERAARHAGVALGTISRSWDEVKGLYGRGYTMVTVASDSALVTQGAGAVVKRFRDEYPRGAR
ncbi:MAG: HpcH/HpaI aldolase/citrate lyase family protein [Candidatus Rokubacteria bacterium]|nr:HpcH/HpaI aldolase/citrate lyase family protein [Candidatus Rokubacteria bacterium]MBI3826168.1 HpcH/HpaI aldolase/citrate lyase family protein [Candidatus Rokubacteria bacterium]